MSNDSLATSLASTATMPNTAATSMTSLNISSFARQTTSDITAAVLPAPSETSSTPLPMPCACCWEEFKVLRTHYPWCPGLKGDRDFWASPYHSALSFYDRDAFETHLRSFEFYPDNLHIESTPRHCVTPRTWTTLLRDDAKKRQLMNMMYEYFRINSEFAEKWQALNDGDMSPNLNNVEDIGDVLDQCSEILCRPQSSGMKKSPIGQLKELFDIDTEGITEIPTQPARWSKKRKMSVSFNALEILTSNDQVKVKVEVEVANTGFTEAEFTRHQQDQIGEQDQNCHLSMGGVMRAGSQWSTSGSSDAAPTGDTSNVPSALEHKTQLTNGAPVEISNGLAEVQYGTQIYFTDDTNVPPQTLQQGQNAFVIPNAGPTADEDLRALYRWYSEYLLQHPLPSQQVSTTHETTNVNASNVVGPFHSWDPPHMQHQQTFPRMSYAHAYPNLGAANGLDTFAHQNSNFMPRYSHTLQRQRQYANTTTTDDLGTARNQLAFPPYASTIPTGYESTIPTGYEYPQYTNPMSYDPHAP